MINFLEVARPILFGPMKEHFNADIYITDTNRIKSIPPNPYVDINVMSLAVQGGTGNIKSETVNHPGEEFESDIKQTRSTEDMVVFSVTANGNDFETAQQVGNFVHDAMHWIFLEAFLDAGFSINQITTLENRTTYQVEDYDYRFGFDVSYLIDRDIVRITDTIEKIIINDELREVEK